MEAEIAQKDWGHMRPGCLRGTAAGYEDTWNAMGDVKKKPPKKLTGVLKEGSRGDNMSYRIGYSPAMLQKESCDLQSQILSEGKFQPCCQLQ